MLQFFEIMAVVYLIFNIMKTTNKQTKVVKNTKKSRIKTNSVVKVLTPKQKAKLAEKRRLNPQFSHAVSKAYKKDLNEIKTIFTRSLIESKKRVDLLKVKELSEIKNKTFISECVKCINYIVKNNDLYTLFEQSVTKNKYGNFQINYNLQLVSKIAKLIDKNNGAITYKKALEQIIIAKNYNNLK